MTAETKPVLVVDLDGTLTHTDTLYEALFALMSRAPGQALRLLPRLTAGKAAFKQSLAEQSLADAATLPLRGSVLALIEAAKSDGRRVALVSASDQRQVTALAEHLGVFDEAHGTTETNLGGAAKAAFLVERYGRQGFDYIGDAHTDLPVWAEARHAITVGADASLTRAVTALGVPAEHLDPPRTGLDRLLPYLKALRPHQWIKNILVFVPILAAHDTSKLGAAIAAFIAFSLMASCVYVMNDLLDLSADRAHPRKRKRPFASVSVPPAHGLFMAPMLFVLAVLIATLFTSGSFMGANFLSILLLYFIANIAYSLLLKRKLIIDIWTLGGLYTARILGGGAATGVVLSPWLLAFSMFLFLSLAAVKRQAELMSNMQQGKAETAGRAYRTDDVPILRAIALSAGYGAVVLFALYLDNPSVAALYPAPQFLWLVCPFLLYWVSRMVMFAHRGDMTDDPIIFALRDRGSIAAIGLAALAVLMARIA